ncbi:MAG: beta-ketoacyl synthase N-terminal-like domain-containing protein [Chloroflexota bacterium]
MSDIVIAGIGQTAAGEHWDFSLRQLAYKAIKAAVVDSGGLKPQALFVGNMLSLNLSNQAHMGAFIADNAGLTGIEAVTIEAAGASGAAALRQAYLAIQSGYVDTALVVGVEKFTDRVGSDVEAAVSTSMDSDYEGMQGLTSTAQAAMIMRRYMHEYDVPQSGFAGFAINAHANGAHNPNAMFQKAIKPETYARAEMVSEPVNMFDAAPNADGAAALMLTRRDLLPAGFSQPLVRIAGSANSTDTLALHDRHQMLAFQAARIANTKALEKAGISLEQISFFEYHDAFSIFAALSLEAAGFAEIGQGWKLAADHAIHLNGKIPCGTMGGLKARGFTGGASGVYQAVEAVQQLRANAGKNQVQNARFGLIQSLGGPASTAVSHVLERI